MTEVFKFDKSQKVNFENIVDKGFFSSSGILYKKIFSQDLHAFGIQNVNAVSLLNGGLTFFAPDEEVYCVDMEYKHESRK